jgi:hypothetical protein
LCAIKRTAGVGAQCYERAVKKWLIVGVLVVAAAIGIAVIWTQSRSGEVPLTDAVVEDFRAVERQAIAAYNTALRRQRANEIDEVELAVAIERDVVEPWRAMRSRVTAGPVPDARRELYTVMYRYIEAREQAWQAYADALRARSDAESRPLYDRYHQKNEDAQRDAQVLGGMFRELGR